jgi:hypothetical protein
MSRGLGHIQRAVLDLIASDADGAWSIGEICQRVYGAVEKKHRVAVGRALRRMELPGTWSVRRRWKSGAEVIIYDACNLRSTTRFEWLRHERGTFDDFVRYRHERIQPGGEYYESVQEAIAYRDADARTRRRMDAKTAKKWGVAVSSIRPPIPRRPSAPRRRGGRTVTPA